MADPTTSLREDARDALRLAGPSVVRIGRAPGRGNGVVVAEGAVLTNAHNLRDRTTEVTFADGRSVQGEVLGADPDGDLVVLSVDTAGAPVAVWSDVEAEPGDVVFAVARREDGGERVSHGLVSGVGRGFRGPRGRPITGSLEHTAPLARGSSGSPVVDRTGRLVGLSTARLADGFYLARPADEELRDLVAQLLRGESRHRLALGVGLAPAEVARELRTSVGLPDQPGLLVRGVAAGSPAAAAGIAVGDLLVAAADAPLTTVEVLHEALDAARTTRVLTLVVLRGTEERSVEVVFPPES